MIYRTADHRQVIHTWVYETAAGGHAWMRGWLGSPRELMKLMTRLALVLAMCTGAALLLQADAHALINTQSPEPPHRCLQAVARRAATSSQS